MMSRLLLRQGLSPRSRALHSFPRRRPYSSDSHSKPSDSHSHSDGGSSNATVWLMGSVAVFAPFAYYVFLADSETSASSSHASDPKAHKYFEISPTSYYPTKRDSSSPSSDASPLGVRNYKYVLVGAGMASFGALESIVENDPMAIKEGNVLIVGNEPERPYKRPPLSKELWFSTPEETASDDIATRDIKYKDWQGKSQSLYYNPTEATYRVISEKDLSTSSSPPGVHLLPGTQVTDLDVDAQIITLDSSQQIHFSNLLLATGGTPRSLPWVDEADDKAKSRIMTFRSLYDFKRLNEITASSGESKGKRVVVIGGGFLGSEISCALARRVKDGLQVTQLFPEDGNMALVFPRYLTKWTTTRLQNEGVNSVPGTYVDSVKSIKEGDEDAVELKLKNGDIVVADYVCLAVGLKPNVALAEKAGLEIDLKLGGIVVNAELRARSNVFAAGDNTSFHDIALGRRHIEHYDHAYMSGRAAGLNMATGQKKPYLYQSMFWSDLGPEIAYEAVGVLDSSLSTVGIWSKSNKNSSTPVVGNESYDKGVVFYMKDKKVVGVLMWNVLNRVDEARRVIRENKTWTDLNELSSVFSLDENKL